MDDKFGVQKNWFTSLYKQLNYLAKTGAVTAIKGRQREVFEQVRGMKCKLLACMQTIWQQVHECSRLAQVEKEFEGLYIKYVRDKKLDDQAHRSMLMCCLSVATYRILNDELGDTKLVGLVPAACQGRLIWHSFTQSTASYGTDSFLRLHTL
jgi:hypothetical protein